SASDDGQWYRKTLRFKIGYRHEPPDRLGFTLLNAVCTRIEAWERSLPADAHRWLLDVSSSLTFDERQTIDAETQALLAQASFSPIYAEWLAEREQLLATRISRLKPGTRKRLLIVNATKGLRFYTSILDFFAAVRRAHEWIDVTSASYFDEVHEFH